MFSNFIKHLNLSQAIKRALLLFVVTCLFFISINKSLAQTGYIQLKTRAISEDVAPEFTYNISGGPTLVTSKVLADKADAFRRIYHIAGESAGGLFVIATSGTTAGTPNPGNIYYRGPGLSEWQNTGFAAFRLDGGANGGFVALVRTSASSSGTASQVWYRADANTTPSNITGALNGKSITQVSHNYSNRIYAVTTESGSNLYSRPADLSSDWAVSANPQNVIKVDAVPNTDNVFTTRLVSSSIRLFQGAYNTNGTLWDNDLGSATSANRDGIYFAATKNASGATHVTYYLPEYGGVYYKKSSSSNWEQDESVNAMQMLTSTGENNQMVYGVLTTGEANLPNRIFSRAGAGEFLGFWIDDERVQTTIKGNTVIIPVAAGNYNIAQNTVAGWHTTDITVWDPSNNSTKTIPTNTVVANVAAGEVVTIEFENQLTSIYNMSNATSCSPAFMENFSSYVNGTYGNPLTGLTSYHKANTFFGYGYYAVMNNLNALNQYAYAMQDHTNDAGRGMFVIDASFEPGTFFRKQFTGLQAGVPYNFTAFIANINRQGPSYTKPNVSFDIYNSSTGALITSVNSSDIPADTTWHGVSIVFTSSVSNIELVLRNNALGTVGNDLAIDDISFSLSIPKPEAKISYDCLNFGTVSVTAPIAASGSPIKYQYSLDGVNWQTSTVFRELESGSQTLYVRYETAGACISSTNLIIVNDCVPLPVSFLAFNATNDNNKVILNWSTMSEKNNYGFEIQKSNNSKDWHNIAFVNARTEDNNINQPFDYYFTDTEPYNGINYYRLKQIDLNQKFEYSSIRQITINNSAITLSPNPAKNYVIIDGLKSGDRINIIDNQGRLLIEEQSMGYKHRLDLHKLSSGFYYIQIINKEKIISTHRLQKIM